MCFDWCGRGDSNSHGLSPTRTSTWDRSSRPVPFCPNASDFTGDFGGFSGCSSHLIPFCTGVLGCNRVAVERGVAKGVARSMGASCERSVDVVRHG